MDKKTILTIVLAIVLALVSAFLLFNKKDVVENTDTLPKQEEIVSEDVDMDLNSNSEDVEKTSTELETQQTAKSEKTISQQRKQAQNASVKPVLKEKTVQENIKIQEATIVEEATDYGIIKDEKTNTITITREFRPSAKSKYLFKGYGQLVETTTK